MTKSDPSSLMSLHDMGLDWTSKVHRVSRVLQLGREELHPEGRRLLQLRDPVDPAKLPEYLHELSEATKAYVAQAMASFDWFNPRPFWELWKFGELWRLDRRPEHHVSFRAAHYEALAHFFKVADAANKVAPLMPAELRDRYITRLHGQGWAAKAIFQEIAAMAESRGWEPLSSPKKVSDIVTMMAKAKGEERVRRRGRKPKG